MSYPSNTDYFAPTGSHYLRNECKKCRNKKTNPSNKKRRQDRIRSEKQRLSNRQPLEENTIESNKSRHLKDSYNISIEDYYRMYEEQRGRCAICERYEGEITREDIQRPGKYQYYLHVDHDEEANLVFSLLCGNCNNGIGYFGYNIQVVQKAAEYSGRLGQFPSEIPILPDQLRYDIPYWECRSRNEEYRRTKNRNLSDKYEITIGQYEWLLAEGDGVCWICHHPETAKPNKEGRYPTKALSVDHYESYGGKIIRGILCQKCKFGIDKFKRNPERKYKAIPYIVQRNISLAEL